MRPERARIVGVPAGARMHGLCLERRGKGPYISSTTTVPERLSLSHAGGIAGGGGDEAGACIPRPTVTARVHSRMERRIT